MFNFLKSAKLRKNIKKNVSNPFVRLKNNHEIIFYDEDDGVDSWANGIIESSTKFSIIAGMNLVSAYRPNNCCGGLETDEKKLIAVCSDSFHIMQTFTLGSLNIVRGGFEKEVWMLVLEKISNGHSEEMKKAHGEIREMLNKVAPDNPLFEKIMSDQETKQKEGRSPYADYLNTKLTPLLEGDIRNTPIEVLQNDLVQHYDYSASKEEKLKKCIRDLSFLTLDGLLSSYYCQKN